MADVASLSDEELVERTRSQDQELYTEIVKRYESKLLRYALSFVRDQHTAEDIIQNAFIKAFINLNGFNTNKKFSSWIYRIVHNESINEIKRGKKQIALEDVPDHLLKDDANVEESIDAKIQTEAVRSHIQQLPLAYRSVIALFFLEEKSYEEISDILRIPIGTVGTRLNRGKKMLSTLIA